MTVFDTDLLTDYLSGDTSLLLRVAAVPANEHAIAVVTVEEMLRGRLKVIRQAQSGRMNLPLSDAYDLLTRTLGDIRRFQVVPYSIRADATYQTWRTMNIRIGTQDLRIAAIAFAHNAKLVTRNARDYTLVPGLNLEVWN